MPRPKKPGDEAKEVKKRSRNGCWPCKARKVKCGEEKPSCATCIRQGEKCDYSIRLNWDGRSKKSNLGSGTSIISFGSPSPGAANSPPITDIPQTSNPAQSPASYQVPNEQIYPLHSSPSHSRTTSQDSILPSIAQFSQGLIPPLADINHATRPAPPVLRNPTWTEPLSASSKASGLAPIPPVRANLSPNAYPSPAESGFGSPGVAPGVFNFGSQPNQMLPPMTSSNHGTYAEPVRSPYNSAKRMRMSPRADNFQRDSSSLPRSSSLEEVPRLQAHLSLPTSFPIMFSNPLTPAASSGSLMSGDTNDDRRISVSSLLSDSNTDERRSSSTTNDPQQSRRGSLFRSSISYSETNTYGHDRGHPDLDMPRNNDIQAINGASPSESGDFELWLSTADLGMNEFAFGYQSRATVFAKGGYYASPVPIKIPRKLEPLPATLTENPMNLLYFHHFLNHTARILVPHDCAENPFKTILPQMAVKDPNLLNLLLAYSACHRARLLGHPEPKNRIAHWVRDLFPHLRQTLDSSDERVSNANLATAIMMASLEIISPSSFGIEVPWQQHLNLARSIIRSRLRPHSVSRKDAVMYFLTRWMAYLDVLGSLSGRKNGEPLFAGNYWTTSEGITPTAPHDTPSEGSEADEDDGYTIDCLMGFTTRCVTILAQVACLAHQCSEHRLDLAAGTVNHSWQPPPDIVKQADRLCRDLEIARTHEQRQCFNHDSSHNRSNLSRRPSYAELSEQDIQESLSTNIAYHWAGLVHLLRRVYNLPASHPRVQEAVHEVIKIIRTIREGGSAMNNILFPMFTAGVEAIEPLDRVQISSRIKSAEELGMFQMIRARKIMEQVWKTGQSWELLVNGEFFG